MEYGNAPRVIGRYDLNPEEMMIYMYLPIKLAGSDSVVRPERLAFADPVIMAAYAHARSKLGPESFDEDHYMYITAKTMYVGPGYSGNRPGWHADGYGSNGDLNFIWYDMNPTEFALQEFHDIPDDDFQSMIEMEKQITNDDNIVYYPCNHLLMLDESVVHRVNPVIKEGFRTFIKISVSKHQFNLKGNSRNYELNYDFEMHDRQAERNMDNNKDYVK